MSTWKRVSMAFAFKAGLRKQPMRSVLRVNPSGGAWRRGAIRESEIRAYNVGKGVGVGARAGVRAAGAIGALVSADDLVNAGKGRTQIDLEGLHPGDFDVGHEIDDVYLGEGPGGSAVYATVRVERNIIFRKKFYIVKLHPRV
jgi:hypothetical protein